MEKAELFKGQELRCANCDKDLFEDPTSSIVVFLKEKNGKFVDVYACCKDECDKKLLRSKGNSNHTSSWKDISDLVNPKLYLRQVFATMNTLRREDKFTDEAFEDYKNILIQCSPYVMRSPSPEELKIADDLLDIPVL